MISMLFTCRHIVYRCSTALTKQSTAVEPAVFGQMYFSGGGALSPFCAAVGGAISASNRANAAGTREGTARRSKGITHANPLTAPDSSRPNSRPANRRPLPYARIAFGAVL